MRTDYAEEVIRRWLPEEAWICQNDGTGDELQHVCRRQETEADPSSGDYSDYLERMRNVAEPFMAGIEMIHTHSLIHDDLPAIDNDDYQQRSSDYAQSVRRSNGRLKRCEHF